jgi:signal transduction histidine kinase
MTDVEGHQHRYRSPVAAIVGLAESALQRDDLDEDLLKQLQAIKLLAKDALAASEDGEIWASPNSGPRNPGDRG